MHPLCCSLLVQVPESVDDSFIIEATNRQQREKLRSLKHSNGGNLLLHVEGPHRLWLQKVPIFYYSLRMSDRLDLKDDGKW